MEGPVVSVIMNCYNGQKYLGAAIDSVRAQTYSDWELIFWDNQSTDKSADIFKSYADSRLKYHLAPKHMPLYAARNFAIDQAKGAFVAFLDVDDYWLPEKLRSQLPHFADSQVGILCSNYWIQSEREQKRWKALKRRPPTGFVLNDLLRSYFVGLLTLMIRRTALNSLDYACDPRYHVVGDADLVIRLAIRWKLDFIDKPLAVFRLHGGNETTLRRARHTAELDCWLAEMERVDAIRSCKNFERLRNHIMYLKAMHHLLQGEKTEAFRAVRTMHDVRLKARLLAALALPTSIVHHLKNQD